MNSKIGIPYNFYFQNSKDTIYCSALVNDALLSSGCKTILKTLKKTSIIPGITGPISQVICAVRPKEFIHGDFDVICKSHNLKVSKNGISLIEDPSRIKKYINHFAVDPRVVAEVSKQFDELRQVRQSVRAKIRNAFSSRK